MEWCLRPRFEPGGLFAYWDKQEFEALVGAQRSSEQACADHYDYMVDDLTAGLRKIAPAGELCEARLLVEVGVAADRETFAVNGGTMRLLVAVGADVNKHLEARWISPGESFNLAVNGQTYRIGKYENGA